MTVEIAIRPMRADEAASVAQLFHDCWHETQAPLQPPLKAKYPDVAFFLERLLGRANTDVAHSNGTLAGFASYTGEMVNSLFVARDHRNRGVGFLLLRHAEQAMQQAGHAKLTLQCVENNHAARRFYERHGWRLEVVTTDRRDKPEGEIFTNIWQMTKP
jgi:putative acetyltransferase